MAGLSKTFEQIFVCRFLTGLFQGTQFGNDRAIAASATPKEKMGLGQGISFSGLGIGMGLGLLLGGYLVKVVGWRQTFVLLALPSFIVAFLISFFLRESRSPQQPTGRQASLGSVSIGMIFKSRDHWLLSIAAFTMVFSSWSVLWIPCVLMEVGLDVTLASVMTSLFGFASVPALTFTGWVSDKLARRGLGRKIWLGFIMVLFGLIMALLARSIHIKMSPLMITLFTFLAGFWYWGSGSVLYSIVAEITPKSIRGTAYGFTNFIGQIGGFSPWIIGWMRDLTGSFIPALYLCSLISSLGGLAAWCIKPAFRARPEIPLARGNP
jgi:MFS family permease